MLGLMVLTGCIVNGQKIIDTWNFATGEDSTLWMDLSGHDSTILIGNDIISGRSGLIAIGFPFQFGASTHTKFSTNVNGTIRLGNTQIPSNGNIVNPLSTDMANGPKVEPFGMQGRFYSDCYTSTALLGDSGNHVRVIETRMSGRYWNSSGNVSFQVQLFETGSLRIVYGETNNFSAGYGSIGGGAQVGLATTTGAGSDYNNKDVIFIDMVNHEAVRFDGNCTQRNPDGVWVTEGRWYELAPDSNYCPYPPLVTTTGNNPASITFANSYGGAADLHLTIPAVGLDTLWPQTLSYLTVDSLFNPATTYTGTVQSVCDGGRTSYRTRPFTFTTGCGQVRYLPWTCTFQNSTLSACWDASQYTTTTCQWKLSSGAMRCGTTSSQSYDEWLLSPIINLPAEEGSILRWKYRAQALNGVSPHVEVRAATCNSDGTVDSNAWVTLMTFDTTYANYSQQQQFLDIFAGQQVRVAFVRTGTGGQYAYVDDVELFMEQVPVINLDAPEMVFVDDTAVLSCSIVSGVTNGVQWEWHSTLTNEWSNDSSHWAVTYSEEGVDTVTVVVSNDYGTDTAMAVIRVVDCSMTIPWEENFAGSGSNFQNDCWVINGWSRRSQLSLLDERDVMTVYPHPMTGSTMNKYMLTPTFDISSTDVENLKFWVQCAADELLVRLSPTGDTALAAFTDTLLYIHGDRQRMRWYLADLSSYAGQTVRMGIFRMLGPQPLVNAVKVDYDTMPVLGKIEGSDFVFTGNSATFSTTLLRGFPLWATYQWHSSLASQDGTMTTNSSGNEVTIVYASGGYDTLTVIVGNRYGADTVTKIVRVVDCSPITSLPWTEEFDDDRLCWHIPSGSQWGYGTMSGINYVQNSPDANLSDSWLISPAITIPADTNLHVRFLWKVSRNHNTDPHHYQVLVSDYINYTDITTYTVLYTDSAVHAAFPDYDYLSVDLSAYAGEMVHIAFHHLPVNNSTSHLMYINGVEVRSSNRPRIDHIVVPDDHYTEDGSLQVEVLLGEGNLNGLTYTWHSTLLDSTVTLNTTLLTLDYPVSGNDTITVVATNTYGSDTAFAVVRVHHCLASVIPFREPFNSDSTLGCWRRWNFYEDSDRGDWRLTGVDPTSHTVMTAGTYYYDANAWLITPAIAIPAVADGLNLKVKVYGATSSSGTTYLTILASTTGCQTVDAFTDTLFHDAFDPEWRQLSLPLNRYAGQQLRIAFVHTGISYSSYGIELDSLSIDYDTVPQVTLTHDEVTMGDTTWFHASLNNCIQTGLYYFWHSSLTGQSGISGSQWPVVYSAGGIDTVTLIVGNLYAADTATIIVEVVDCSPRNVPFVVDFEGVTASVWDTLGAMPHCWDIIWNGSTAAYAPHVVTTNGYRWIGDIPNKALFMIAGSNPGYDTVAMATLPRMADSLQNLSIAFDYRFESASIGTLQVGYLVDSAFIAVQSMVGHYGDYLRDTVSFADATVPDARIALRWRQSYSWYAVVVDNIEVFVDHTLPAPVVTVDSVDDTHAQLSWSAVVGATGYHVEVVGVMDTTLNPSLLSLNLSGLIPGTTYTVHVAALAGADTGHIATTQFSTPCTLLHLPYSINFSSVAVGSLPTCWSYQWAGFAEYAPQVVSGGVLRLITRPANIVGYDNYSAVTLPAADDTLSHYMMTLLYRTEADFSAGYVRVGYMSGGSFVMLADLSTSIYPTYDTVILSSVPDNVRHLTICCAKTGSISSANILDIYELSIVHDSLIRAPANLHADSITGECASLSWNSVREASAYHVIVDGVLDTVVTDTTFTICGLSGTTSYTVHVAGIVGSDTGVYAHLSFTTLCGMITVPFFEDFDSYTSVPQCWYYLGSGYDNFVNWNGWGEFCHSGIHAMRLTVATFGYGQLFATPVVAAPADSLQVSFWTRNTAIYSDTLLAGVMTDPDDESSFVPLLRIYPTETYARYTFDTRGIDADRVRVAFRHKGQVTVASIIVDDIHINRLIQHTVNITSNVEGVCETYGSGSYNHGDTAIIGYHLLDTLPVGGYWQFLGWNDGATANPRSVVVTSDTILSALFQWVADTLWRTVTVTTNVLGAAETYGSGVYADSSLVEIGYTMVDTTTMGGHWQFLGWNDGGMGNPRDIVVTSDTTIVALFEWVPDTTEGIGEIDNSKLKFVIYPNPAHGDVTVSVGSPATLSVFDLSGRTVIPPTAVSFSFVVSRSLLSTGVYYVSIATDLGTTIKKLIIQ